MSVRPAVRPLDVGEAAFRVERRRGRSHAHRCLRQCRRRRRSASARFSALSECSREGSAVRAAAGDARDAEPERFLLALYGVRLRRARRAPECLHDLLRARTPLPYARS